MDTNALIRDHVSHLIDLGINQSVIAKRMGLSPAWFSRWVNRKSSSVIPVSALDGFAQYLLELLEAIQTAGTTAESAVLQIKRLERERPTP